MTDLNPYRPPVPDEPAPIPAANPATLGLIPQIRAVSAVMFVQGLFNCAFGASAIAFLVILRFDGEDPSGHIPMQIVTVLVSLCGFIPGVMYLFAGILNFFFRGRNIGILAIWVGLLSVFTCVCGPTAIAVMIYGAIVYYDRPVIAAFRLAETGRSVEDVLAAAHAGRLT